MPSRRRFASRACSKLVAIERAWPNQTFAASLRQEGHAPASVMPEPSPRAPALGSSATSLRERLGRRGHRRTASMVSGEPFASHRAHRYCVRRTLPSVRRHQDPMLRRASPVSPARNQLRLPRAQPSGPRVLRQPGEDVAGALVRRKHGIKHVLDGPLVDNEREPLEQCHACGLQSRQVERLRQLEVLVR